jgi:hypothetical protein
MDLIRLREDFEGLAPEEQMEFMASIGPEFCSRVMRDPARLRQMVARHLAEGTCPLARIARRVARARITLAALMAGVRAAGGHLSQGASPGTAR